MASQFWLATYIVRLFDSHFSAPYFSRLKCASMPHNVTIIKHQPWTLSVVLPVFICQPLLTWQYWWVAPSKTRTQHKGNVWETCFSSNGLCQIILYWDKKENITLSTLNTCIFSDHFLGSWYMISSENILKPSPKAFALLFPVWSDSRKQDYGKKLLTEIFQLRRFISVTTGIVYVAINRLQSVTN